MALTPDDRKELISTIKNNNSHVAIELLPLLVLEENYGNVHRIFEEILTCCLESIFGNFSLRKGELLDATEASNQIRLLYSVLKKEVVEYNGMFGDKSDDVTRLYHIINWPHHTSMEHSTIKRELVEELLKKFAVKLFDVASDDPDGALNAFNAAPKPYRWHNFWWIRPIETLQDLACETIAAHLPCLNQPTVCEEFHDRSDIPERLKEILVDHAESQFYDECHQTCGGTFEGPSYTESDLYGFM